MKSKPSLHATASDTSAAVDAFMSVLAHPYKAEVEALRELILGAAPGISEGIKWRTPSYRTEEYFATTNLREKNGVGVILHLGAKVRDLSPGGLVIDDPEGLLKWLAPDRAAIVFTSTSDIQTKRSAFTNLIRNWIKHV